VGDGMQQNRDRIAYLGRKGTIKRDRASPPPVKKRWRLFTLGAYTSLFGAWPEGAAPRCSGRYDFCTACMKWYSGYRRSTDEEQVGKR
jgi:hypothetical protein